MRMVFEFEDGKEIVIRDIDEGNCVAQAAEYTEDHGDITYYSEVEEDSFLYPEDGWQ